MIFMMVVMRHSLKATRKGVLNNKESLWEIAFYHSQGRRNGGAVGDLITVRRWRNLPEFLHLNQVSIWDVPMVSL